MNTKIKLNTRRKHFPIIGILAFISILVAACAPSVQATQEVSTPGAFQGSGSPTQSTGLAPSTSSEEAEIKVASDPALGNILVDGRGMTLYIFTKDTADTSNCDASCLAKWPPLLTLGSPKADSGVDQSMIGSTTTTDGRKIVTYNHMPLYYFVKDMKPGDTQGQDVGSVWYVISPDGKVVSSAGATSPTAAPASTSAAPSSSSAEPTINVASDAKLGQFLVDGKGMTLYMFTQDTADKSNCDAACLEKWPPLLTLGSPILGTGVDDSKLGTATLADGKLIVTYNHMPLYYFFKDTKAGDTTGQGVGSVWYVVSPDGEIIK